MVDTEKVELYRTDYVILLPPHFKEFYRFKSGEIVIYGNLQEAHKDAREIKACTAVSTGIFPHMQEILIENIKQFKK